MKKALVALPFIATASWAGTTMYNGSQTRAMYDELIAQLDLSTTFKVSNESYAAGFARSQAVTRVASGTGPDAEVLFRILHDIDHSPVGFNDGSARLSAARIVSTLDISTAEGKYADFLASFESSTPFLMVSNAGFNGTIESTLTMAALDWQMDDLTIKSDGARYDIVQTRGGKVSGTGGLAPLTISGPDAIVELSASEDHIDVEYVAEALLNGTQSMSFDSVSIQNISTGIKVGLDDISFTLDSTVDNDILNAGIVMGVGQVRSDIPVPLDSIDLGARISGLNLANHEKIAEISNEAHLATIKGDDMAELAAIGSFYRETITKGTALEYSISMRNAGGEVNGKTIMTFEGDDSVTGFDTLDTVGDLIQVVKITADLDADRDAIAMTPAAMFLANEEALAPWILPTDTSYTSRIVIDDSALHANGMAFPVGMFIGEIMAMPLDMSTLESLDEQQGTTSNK